MATLTALDAVPRDLRAAGVDAFVIAGDMLPGPIPREALARLLALDWPTHFIHGNGDRVVAAFLAGGDITEAPEAFRDTVAWTAQQLDAEQRALLTTRPSTCTLEVAEVGGTLFCHATPRNDVECFTRVAPEARLRSVCADVVRVGFASRATA